MNRVNKLIMVGLIVGVLTGCLFRGPQIRYVVDVRPPPSRDGALEDQRQDKGHPAIDGIRPTIKLKPIKTSTENQNSR